MFGYTFPTYKEMGLDFSDLYKVKLKKEQIKEMKYHLDNVMEEIYMNDLKFYEKLIQIMAEKSKK